jgi:hypothetical protein
MRHAITVVFVVGVLLMPTVVSAGERLFDGALGAASGALLFGAPGLVAGGAIGYAAGPRISRGLGFHRHYRYGYSRYGYYNGYSRYGYYSRCWDRACW